MGIRVKPRREKDIQAELLRYLSLRGVFCWRNNSGAAPMPSGHFVRFGSPGSADILGVLSPSGRLLGVECKRPGGKPTALQQSWMDSIKAAGGVAICASSIAQLEEGLLAAGVNL